MGAYIRSLKFWLGLFIILASIYVYYLGYKIHTIDPKVDRAAFIAAIWTHVGYGMLLFVPIIIYAVKNKKHAPIFSTDAMTRRIINLFQFFLILQIITGPIIVWTRGSALKVFDWFVIPSPMPRVDALYEFMEHLHKFLNYPLVLFFGLSVIVMTKRLWLQLTD